MGGAAQRAWSRRRPCPCALFKTSFACSSGDCERDSRLFSTGPSSSGPCGEGFLTPDPTYVRSAYPRRYSLCADCCAGASSTALNALARVKGSKARLPPPPLGSTFGRAQPLPGPRQRMLRARQPQRARRRAAIAQRSSAGRVGIGARSVGRCIGRGLARRSVILRLGLFDGGRFGQQFLQRADELPR